MRECLHAYIGRPYDAAGGRDCWAFVKDVCRDVFHKQVPDYSHSPLTDEEATMLIWRGSRDGQWSKVDKPEEGDVLVFRIGKWSCHCGVYVGSGNFMHALKGRNSTMERLDRDGWSNRLVGIYRWN